MLFDWLKRLDGLVERAIAMAMHDMLNAQADAVQQGLEINCCMDESDRTDQLARLHVLRGAAAKLRDEYDL